MAVSAEGFKPKTRTGIELRVQGRLAIDFVLQVCASASEVTVTAQGPLLESETSSLGQIVEARTIQDLPLNGRNFIQLATLTTGTLPSSRTAERDNFISNGARAIQNSNLLDGVENKNRILGFDRSAAQIIQPVVDAPPLGGKRTSMTIDKDGRTMLVSLHAIDNNFFDTMKLPLVRGRNLTSTMPTAWCLASPRPASDGRMKTRWAARLNWAKRS